MALHDVRRGQRYFDFLFMFPSYFVSRPLLVVSEIGGHMAGFSLPPPDTPPPIYIGRVGVGCQRHCKTCRSLGELDNQGTVVFFGDRSKLVVQLDNLCEVKNLYSAQEN